MKKLAKEQLNPELVSLIRERLGKFEEIENIYVDYVSKKVVKVIVITKNINPKFERELIKIENEVEEKYRIPSKFFTFSSASTIANLTSC